MQGFAELKIIKELFLTCYSSHRSAVPTRRTSQLLPENLKQQQYEIKTATTMVSFHVKTVAAARYNGKTRARCVRKKNEIARKSSHMCQNNWRDWNSYGHTELGLCLNYHQFT